MENENSTGLTIKINKRVIVPALASGFFALSYIIANSHGSVCSHTISHSDDACFTLWDTWRVISMILCFVGTFIFSGWSIALLSNFIHKKEGN
jgi:hypothetical protein